MSVRVGNSVVAGNPEDTVVTTNTAQTVTGNKSFTGTVTATTQTYSDKSTKVATTSFVDSYQRYAVIDESIYPGESLNTKFSSEISSAGSIWAFLHNRASAGNYVGIHVGDYFTYQTNAGSVAGIHTNTSTPNVGTLSVAAATRTAYIIGLDHYTGSGADTNAIGHEITCFTIPTDFFCMWNPTNNNNGTATNNQPWLASQLYAVLNGVSNNSSNKIGNTGYASSGKGILQLFPTAAQNVMVAKKAYLSSRYSADAALTSSTTITWQTMGKLWAPSEIEVYGCPVHSIHTNTGVPQWELYGNSLQYPFFARSIAHGRLVFGRTSWWTSSIGAYTSSTACGVSGYGYAAVGNTALATYLAPLCFNIG